jgi:hypothetical protein|tara:strand:+ start:144 stop:722 length:579 start_codon:yes stop_codon:yes gene_type:complete
MSEENYELDELKELADTMGVSYHPAIGLEKLKAKMAEADTSVKPVAELEEEEVDSTPVLKKPKKESLKNKTQAAKDRALKLVRIRIACMDPSKQGLPGEIFSTGNKFTGRIKKYVPYDTDWHVPSMLLKMIQARQTQIFVKKKERSDSGAMVETTKGKMVKAYSVEILPDLTQKEIDALGQRQLAARGTQED